MRRGYVPVGLDYEVGGRCQIPGDTRFRQGLTVRCMVDGRLPDGPSPMTGFAVFAPRPR